MRCSSAVKRPASSGDVGMNQTQSASSMPLQFRCPTRDPEAGSNIIKSGRLPRIEPQPSSASALASLLSPPGQHLHPRHHTRLQLPPRHQWADPPWFDNHLKLPFHKQERLLEADTGGLHLQEGIQCLQWAGRRTSRSPWLGLCHWVRVWRKGGNGDEGKRGKSSLEYFYPIIHFY